MDVSIISVDLKVTGLENDIGGLTLVQGGLLMPLFLLIKVRLAVVRKKRGTNAVEEHSTT